MKEERMDFATLVGLGIFTAAIVKLLDFVIDVWSFKEKDYKGRVLYRAYIPLVLFAVSVILLWVRDLGPQAVIIVVLLMFVAMVAYSTLQLKRRQVRGSRKK